MKKPVHNVYYICTFCTFLNKKNVQNISINIELELLLTIYRVSQKKGGDWVYSTQKIINEKIFVIFFFYTYLPIIYVLKTFFFRQQKKRYGYLKSLKKLDAKFWNFFLWFFSPFEPYDRKIFKYKQKIFLVYVAKSISF